MILIYLTVGPPSKGKRNRAFISFNELSELYHVWRMLNFGCYKSGEKPILMLNS